MLRKQNKAIRKKGQVVHAKETESSCLVTHLFYRPAITLAILYGSKQDCQDEHLVIQETRN